MSSLLERNFYIYNFIGSWFSDDYDSDENIIQRFVFEVCDEEISEVLKQGDELINSSEFKLEKISYEANRSFETEEKAREWLKKILDLIKSEYAKQHGKKDIK